MAEKTKSPVIGMLTPHFSEDSDYIYIKGKCFTRMLGAKSMKLDTDLITLETPFEKESVSISFGKRFGTRLASGWALNSCEIRIDKQKALKLDMQNKLVVNYNNEFFGRVLYSMYDLKAGKSKCSRPFIVGDTTLFIRQNDWNTMFLTVRPVSFFDKPEGIELIERAYRESKKIKDRDYLLMYEKECSRYEESASVLFEKLVDMGYENIYYIVNKDNPKIQDLPEKYRKHMLDKNSVEHIARFFACKNIVATETIDHAVQLRLANRRVASKIKDPDINYVFLQHGVMYMVSLSSSLRVGFKNNTNKFYRVVVSSQAEADHFLELGGKTEEQIYVTGLAKFDKSVRFEDADRIVIMPTWRRWETNQADANVEETGYYRLVKMMYDGVPDEYKDKTVILPHPLMADKFKGDNGLSSHILLAPSYDDVLKTCDVLITDYSSIAYDAFYRGAKVVFCWQDKDECMLHYGEEAFLMLNDENVFGDVCYNEKDVHEAVKKAYMQPQTDEYVNKYRHIVEFNDNRNSERIVECMKKDGLI